MSDMPDYGSAGYRQLFMKQIEHPAHNVPDATEHYHGYLNSIPTGTSGDRAADAVNREKKSDSEKKDQSRYPGSIEAD